MPKLNSTEILGDLRVTNDATVDATLTTNSLSVEGNILLTGDATTTNQGRLIDFTGFDKEGTTDFSDRAFIQHTTNTGGHTGSVLLISSQNDSTDGIAFATNGSSYLKHNSNNIFTDAYHPNADKWTTARTLSLTGDVTGSVSWDGSGNASLTTTVANNSHEHSQLYENSTITYGASYLQWMDQSGTGGSGGNGAAPRNPANGWYHNLIMNHANSTGYYSQISTGLNTSDIYFTRVQGGVAKDWQRIFADDYHPNADKWTTARTLSLTGDVTGSVSWDGSANASITTTVVNDSHNHDHSDGNFTVNGGLIVEGSIDSGGTDYGYYQSAGTNIILKGDGSGRSGLFFESEKNGTNINDPSDYGFIQFHAYGYGNNSGEANGLYIGVANDSTDGLVLQTPYNGGAKIGYKNATTGTGLTTETIASREWVNSQGFLTSETGDIQGVTAGDGLTGGGTSGTVTLNVGAGTGISVAADTVGIANTFSPRTATELGSSQNLNDLLSSSTGFYYQAANADTTGNNYPSGEAGSLLVQKSAGSVTQTYITYNSSPKVYVRTYYTSWGSWQRVFLDNYHPNADKWTTARTITLGGDLSGSVSLDGSANVTLTAAVANDSHSHSNYVATSGDSMTGNLQMDYEGNTLADRGSHGILFQGYTAAPLNSTYTRELYMDDQSDLKFGTETIFHTGNDGSGSGLDADKTDGKHIWVGTLTQYNAITTKDSNTIYFIT